MKRVLTLIIAALCTATVVAYAATNGHKLSKKEKAELVAQQVKRAIDERTLSIDVIRRLGSGFDSGSSARGYSLTVDGDSVWSALPHFAVSDMPQMGGIDQESLHFSSRIQIWETQPKQKDKNTILFQVANHGREYVYQLEIYDNGKTIISVYNNRSGAVGFEGELNLPPVTNWQ